MIKDKIRKAIHAGSWYESDSNSLQKELIANLAKAQMKKINKLKAIISP